MRPELLQTANDGPSVGIKNPQLNGGTSYSIRVLKLGFFPYVY
jgi:hypothetical protein